MKTKFFNSAAPKNNQDAFDKILAWLTRPDASLCAGGPQRGCSYRSSDGNNACAIGVLMPTKLARGIDNAGGVTNIVTVLESRSAAKKWFAKCDVEFLSEMQSFHDDNVFCDSKSDCLNKLESIANTYKLKIPKNIVAFFSK
jgi:hypothetical protein